MIAIIDHFSFDALDDAILVLVILALFENMLNYVVSKLVLVETLDVCKNEINDWSRLSILAVLKNALYDSTSIGMHAEFPHNYRLFANSRNNEIDSFMRHFLDTFLDDMITILIIDAVKD